MKRMKRMRRRKRPLFNVPALQKFLEAQVAVGRVDSMFE